MKRIQLPLTTVLWILGVACTLGRDAIELESRYDGNGWFHYRLRTLEDPFLTGIHFGQLLPSPFVNYLTNTLPDHWTNFYYNGAWTGIVSDSAFPQARINEIDFSVRSSSTSFKRQAHGFETTILLEFVDRYFYGGQLGGYINLDCLVPCAPQDADGSLPMLDYRAELVPDIKIDELIRTNQEIYGLSFSWTEPSTVQLEGSHNLVDWTIISRFFGNPPQTTWTTNVPLNSFGQFFRLSLIANSHLTKNQASGPRVLKLQSFLESPVKRLEFVEGHEGR